MQFGLNDEAREQLRDLIRAIDANTAALGGVKPPPPAPADCCEHGADCTRSTR